VFRAVQRGGGGEPKMVSDRSPVLSIVEVSFRYITCHQFKSTQATPPCSMIRFWVLINKFIVKEKIVVSSNNDFVLMW